MRQWVLVSVLSLPKTWSCKVVKEKRRTGREQIDGGCVSSDLLKLGLAWRMAQASILILEFFLGRTVDETNRILCRLEGIQHEAQKRRPGKG